MESLPHEKEIEEYSKTIERLKEQNRNGHFNDEITRLEGKLNSLKKTIFSSLTPWQRVTISRHPERPRAIDYILNITDSFQELSGDRAYRDDPAIIGGLATIQGERCILIGQEKGKDTESRMKRNFGMVNPEGFRKARRLMKLAEKFSLPVATLVDTPGAYPGLGAEERGQGLTIAENLIEMAGLKVPIVSLIIGEGCSGGALGIAVADIVGILEHAYYSVISPEGCASILWKEASKKEEAALRLKLNAENLLELRIIDEILKEPLGGAHTDPSLVYQAAKNFFSENFRSLSKLSLNALLDQRYEKYRKMGPFNE